MAVTGVRSGEWALVDEVPERVVASCLYDSAAWLRAWEGLGIEQRTRHAYVAAGEEVLPLYETTFSPFWHEYERQCGLEGRFGDPIVFAGSSYSVYSKRGRVDPRLVEGAFDTAMDWIRGGEAELLVVPNLTSAGVDSWLEVAGPPVGTVHLERTYGIDVDGSFGDHLSQPEVRVRVVDGRDAHSLVGEALSLTGDKNALFDEAALHGMLDIPGALMVAAEVDGRLVGAYFEWGRDNYRVKERHGLVGTELWAMIYSPVARPELATAINRMHATRHAHIEAA